MGMLNCNFPDLEHAVNFLRGKISHRVALNFYLAVMQAVLVVSALARYGSRETLLPWVYEHTIARSLVLYLIQRVMRTSARASVKMRRGLGYQVWPGAVSGTGPATAQWAG